MITAVHSLVYADDPEAARAFFRDVLGWPHVDAGDGWLIFRTGPFELGVHPTSTTVGPAEQHHQVSLMCDDIEVTVAELTAKGAVFDGEVRDEGYGLVIMLAVPGAGQLLLYQPKHPPAYDL
ncbi:MAG: VOC family protein [Streptosporangiales bacterium]|nr:VOC family protein [Streptosporangiales bacterium]